MTNSEVIIGLEIHVQLNTKVKLFCNCLADYSKREPNTSICPICAGQPGAKPMAFNSEALRCGLILVKALNLTPVMDKDIYVQRKHYFYPDLPSGYQRTSKPIGKGGNMEGVEIWEIHLEEDPGRYELKKGYVDYNRSGVPLAEIVTAPQIKSPSHAKEFLNRLESFLRYYNVVKDEVGSIRIDANISLAGHNRVEVKNINSFSNVFAALNFEIKRQKNLLDQGVEVEQETRHFDESSGITVRLRKKETADDYRYLPDPDILPIIIDSRLWNDIASAVSEFPSERAERFTQQFGLESYDAGIITMEKEFADLFESLAYGCGNSGTNAKNFAYWLRGPFRKHLNNHGVLFRKSGILKEDIETLYRLFSEGKLTDRATEKVLDKLIELRMRMTETTGAVKSVDEIVSNEGLLRSVDYLYLKSLCSKAFIDESNRKSLDDYKAGKEKALFFIVGKLMRESNGRLDAKDIERELKVLLTI